MTDDAIPREQITETADGLRRLLGAIRAGDLTAGPGLVNRLEGAASALDALTGRTGPHEGQAPEGTP